MYGCIVNSLLTDRRANNVPEIQEEGDIEKEVTIFGIFLVVLSARLPPKPKKKEIEEHNIDDNYL